MNGQKLFVRNVGSVSALDLEVRFDPPTDGRMSPVLGSQLNGLVPVSELAPGVAITLVLRQNTNSASSQTAHRSWSQPNGGHKSQSSLVQF